MVSNLVAAGAATVVFVDGENTSHGLAGQIMAKTQPFGRALVSRVYGDVARLPAWEAAAGFEMIHTGHAKNGADMRICIDALDLVARGAVGRVVIASSDRDFTHLAQYLRAKGIEVVGMGEAKTHESFRKACSRFMELGVAAAQQLSVLQSSLKCADARVVAMVQQWGEAGLTVGKLGAEMRVTHQMDAKSLGCRSWGRYLAAFPNQFTLEAPVTPTYRVWLKQ